jgi:glycerophosphoryl diester phosphodiesterase
MVQVIGHRGIAGLEPENTLRSFRRAIALGVDYVECDVRLTADRRLVLLHDETVDRTTDGTGRVADLAFEAVRALDAGRGERVPALEELLDLLEGRCKAHIELKGAGTEGPTLRLVQDREMLGDAVLTSGDTERLGALRALSPDVAIEHIFGEPPPDAIARALRVRAQRVSVHHRHATRDYVQAAHAAGLQVIAWPPNTEAEMQAAIDLGVDFLCTDRPDLLLRLLGR